MNKNYEVIRKGECITCETKASIIFLGEFEAENKEEAIDNAIDRWLLENFGQGGALREEDISKEENFMNAKFTAKEIKE